MEMRRVRDGDELSRAAAGLFAESACEAVNERGRFFVALSGGSTPKPIFRLLAEPPLRDEVPWEHVEFFWGDERCVPSDHVDSNYRMACENFLDRLGIKPGWIHRMEAEREDLDQAAWDYQKEIAVTFGVPEDGQPPPFDLALQGMGTDGHTASLFPYTEALKPTDRWIVGNYVPKLESHRMTMTETLLNRARCVVIVVKGEAKAEVLQEVLEGPADPDRLPIQRIRPSGGRLIWIVM